MRHRVVPRVIRRCGLYSRRTMCCVKPIPLQSPKQGGQRHTQYVYWGMFVCTVGCVCMFVIPTLAPFIPASTPPAASRRRLGVIQQVSIIGRRAEGQGMRKTKHIATNGFVRISRVFNQKQQKLHRIYRICVLYGSSPRVFDVCCHCVRNSLHHDC